MPFCPHSLRVIACAGSFTLWHYRTGDSRDTVLGRDYFARATGLIRSGDVLIIEHRGSKDGDNAVSLYAVLNSRKPIATKHEGTALTDESSCF